MHYSALHTENYNALHCTSVQFQIQLCPSYRLGWLGVEHSPRPENAILTRLPSNESPQRRREKLGIFNITTVRLVILNRDSCPRAPRQESQLKSHPWSHLWTSSDMNLCQVRSDFSLVPFHDSPVGLALQAATRFS